MFGDGTLTACKPISDDDLADYLADCLDDPSRHNRVLPIGGPGEAITPRQQGEHLFALLGQPPRFRQVPVALLDVIIGVLGTAGRVLPALAAKAELARIGRYYATESMLVLDPATGRYDAAATPSTGTETLCDYYAALVRGAAVAERGEHAVSWLSTSRRARHDRGHTIEVDEPPLDVRRHQLRAHLVAHAQRLPRAQQPFGRRVEHAHPGVALRRGR